MFSDNRTRIVCTIGPASDSLEVLEQMTLAGMNVARLNFSHGDFSGHQATIAKIRTVAAKLGRRVAIMADLPGPKIRIGSLDEESFELAIGDPFILTTQELTGNRQRASVTLKRLPQIVKPGDRLFLNDGVIQLEVLASEGHEVKCQVLAGGELRSRKGLNLPGIDLGMSAFTEQDRDCLEFALEQGVDAVSQSFVANAADVEAVRECASSLGYRPFILAKIERTNALQEIGAILNAADGIMIARGDLGVEVPIEKMAVVQKELMSHANRLGKPVITATQMLHSMVNHSRPTRAEATDVANAIIDGTDCVMLSEESAMGQYPVEAIQMLARIAAETEPHRPPYRLREALKEYGRDGNVSLTDLIALSVELTLQRVRAATVIVPTLSGATARNIARFRLTEWITVFSPSESTCQNLQFSYGVYPEKVDKDRPDWDEFTRNWLSDRGISGELALLVEGPSQEHPHLNYRMEILQLDH